MGLLLRTSPSHDVILWRQPSLFSGQTDTLTLALERCSVILVTVQITHVIRIRWNKMFIQQVKAPLDSVCDVILQGGWPLECDSNSLWKWRHAGPDLFREKQDSCFYWGLLSWWIKLGITIYIQAVFRFAGVLCVLPATRKVANIKYPVIINILLTDFYLWHAIFGGSTTCNRASLVIIHVCI